MKGYEENGKITLNDRVLTSEEEVEEYALMKYN